MIPTHPAGLQKIGGLAAFANALIGAGALVVAIGLIGPAALADPGKLADLAIHNPAPLIIQDALKLASAVTACVLIAALFNRLRTGFPAVMVIASSFGLLSVLCLLANAGLSLFVLSQTARGMAAGAQLQGLIGLLGMAVIVANGVWYLLVGWAALKAGRLPRPLCYLGVGMGGLSLLPPLGIVVLLLSLAWSVWLGLVLWGTP